MSTSTRSAGEIKVKLAELENLINEFITASYVLLHRNTLFSHTFHKAIWEKYLLIYLAGLPLEGELNVREIADSHCRRFDPMSNEDFFKLVAEGMQKENNEQILTEYLKTAAQQVIQLKQKRSELYNYTGDVDYVWNSQFDELDDKHIDSHGSDKLHEGNGEQIVSTDDSEEERARFWINEGNPILLLNIGSSHNDIKGKATFRPKYEQQMWFKVDVVSREITYTIFLYEPADFSEVKALGYRNNLNRFKRHFVNELEKFKYSRVLKMTIPFDSIERIHFHTSGGMALLALDILQPPRFFNKRVDTEAFWRNQWRERLDFTNDRVASTFKRHYIVADSHIQKSVALMLEADERLAKIYSMEDARSFLENESRRFPEDITSVPHDKTVCLPKERKERPFHPPTREMLQLLVDKAILSADSLSGSGHDNGMKLLGDFPECFRDAVCMFSVPKMKQLLESNVALAANDSQCCCENLTKMTVADLVHNDFTCKYCDTYLYDVELYYSFCALTVKHTHVSTHCSKCHKCRDSNYWHCPHCNRCTYGQTTEICKNCGYEDTQKFHSSNGKVRLRIATCDSDVEDDDNSNTVELICQNPNKEKYLEADIDSDTDTVSIDSTAVNRRA